MTLVVGATGLLGTEICQRLIRRGEKVKALVRVTSSREKVELLRSSGCELCLGDLKDPGSLAAACRGVNVVISTASSTLSRQAGDSIETVDASGQLQLIQAAKAAHIDRFILASFRHHPGFSFPLNDAKVRAEEAIADMNFTIVQASFFMEAWLSPMLGFDYVNAAARIYGPGAGPISWVSSRDVAEMCVVACGAAAADRQTIEFGGPAALTPLQVVSRFEEIGGRRFKLEHVPEEMLRAQFEQATDSLQKSLSALMLGYMAGDAIDMTAVVDKFGLRLTSVDEYARSVLGRAVSA